MALCSGDLWRVCICMCDCMVLVRCVCLPKGTQRPLGILFYHSASWLYFLEKTSLEILLLFSHHSTGTAKLRSAEDLNAGLHVLSSKFNSLTYEPSPQASAGISLNSIYSLWLDSAAPCISDSCYTDLPRSRYMN